jgi:hypothetical protein
MIGIGIPKSHSSIGIAHSPSVCLPPRARSQSIVTPASIAKLSALDGGQARGKRTEKEIRGHPERHLRSAPACTVGRSFGFGDNVVHALFGVGLTYARSRRDQSHDVSSVCGSKVGVLSEAGRPQTRHLGARRIGCGGSGCRGRGGVRTEKPIDMGVRSSVSPEYLCCARC